VAAPTTNEATPQQLPANVHPAQVANQIAQQVDLYRLPGARGVRIQLHPEDLGGVQVTLRYANGGNLELHISVEHAATGALVQAGMPQLRDALATQGFHADRLVMSVTAPAEATSSQMDFSSNNNGSYRSDTSGMAAFTQNGQSNSHRDTGAGAEDASPPRGWRSDSDDATRADETPRGATSNSRIDYRV
jgi:flagellar hook-length control protein FliK